MVPSATKAPTCSSMEGRLGSITISINYGRAGRELCAWPSVGCRCRIIPLTFRSQSPLWQWEQEAVRWEPARLSAFMVSISYSCHLQSTEISLRKICREQAPSPRLRFALLGAPMLVHPLILRYPCSCYRKSKCMVASVKENRVVIIIVIITVVVIKKAPQLAGWVADNGMHVIRLDRLLYFIASAFRCKCDARPHLVSVCTVTVTCESRQYKARHTADSIDSTLSWQIILKRGQPTLFLTELVTLQGKLYLNTEGTVSSK